MQTIDFRDHSAVLNDEANRTYVVLGSGVSCLFHWGRGNTVPWPHLEAALRAKLPGGPHEGLGDVSLSALPEIAIDARCGRDAAAWFAQALLDRRLVAPSTPVTLLHPDGTDEDLGPAAAVAAVLRPTAALAA